MIENPQPSWLPFLLLALPGIGFAAYAVNKFLFPNDDRPLCTVGAIGLVLALLPTHLLALATGSLNLGLAGAWIGIGAAVTLGLVIIGKNSLPEYEEVQS